MLRRYARPGRAGPIVLDDDSFVSARLGLVYHCVSKTLGRAVLQYLEALDPAGRRVAELDDTPGCLLDAATDGPDLVRFSFTRNPYSRAVAVYYDKFVNYDGAPGQRAMFAAHQGITPSMTFSAFVEWLSSPDGSDELADPHSLSQHYFLLSHTGDPGVDYVGSVETADDLAELQAELGLEPCALPRVNSNATRAKAFDTAGQWRDVLDDRSIRLLTSRYDGDFELLRYPRLPFRTTPAHSPLTVHRRPVRPVAATPSLAGRGLRALNTAISRVGLEVRRKKAQPVDTAVQ